MARNAFDILFVDDDSQILALGEEILENDMFNVDTTTNPEEAYEMFVANDYEAVISDYDMPEMNGAELLNEVRRMDRETPFFIHTGRDINEIAVSETQQCLTEYYQKAGLERYRELAETIKKCSEIY